MKRYKKTEKYRLPITLSYIQCGVVNIIPYIVHNIGLLKCDFVAAKASLFLGIILIAVGILHYFDTRETMHTRGYFVMCRLMNIAFSIFLLYAYSYWFAILLVLEMIVFFYLFFMKHYN